MMNRYRVVRFIGRGGMGAVYLCEDLRLPGKQWALKEMILHDPGVAEQVRDSFQREAQFLAGLRHRSLPLIVDVFSIDDRQYLVMEYIHGETLAQRVENRGIPSDTTALGWALELAQVLDYLHRQERPIIFRDLKPENIIVTDDGHIKVIDFGLARHFEPGKRRDTQASGTVGYAPPEQWEDSGQSDPRSDIYSLAATLFYVLTGKPPSPIYGSHRIRPYRPDIDPGIEALVLRCLQPDPSQRYRSAAELIKDLLILLSEDRHQGAMHRPESSTGTAAPSRPPRGRHAYRPGALRAPLRYPQKLPYLLGVGLVLFLIGAFLPFVSMSTGGASVARGDQDPITELLEATEVGKDGARKLLSEGKYEQAIAALDALLTRYPQDAEAHILKNNAYVAMSGQPIMEIPIISSWHGVEREGFQLLYGYALAQSQLNRTRMSKKPLISLKLYDDRSDTGRLLEIVQEILDDPKVAVLVGPYTSQSARLVAPLVNGKGLPTITPVASDPRLLATGRFLLCVSDTDIKKVRALATKLYDDGCRKAAVFANESSILSRSLAEVFLETFQAKGGLIACNEVYPPNQLDFALQVQLAKAQQADCVFLGEYRVQPVVGFCESAKRLGLNAKVAAQTPGYSENLFRNGQESVEGLYVSTYYVPEGGSAENQRFVRDFREMFGGRSPSHREVQAYDTLELAVTALDAVGIDRVKVMEYMEALGNERPAYDGISGTFAPSKNLDARTAHILKVSQGAYQLLD
jgi:ABC-type branched-subunit amino acid transport system substrate-binding protein/predicted Ser/Thr protein kinase